MTSATPSLLVGSMLSADKTSGLPNGGAMSAGLLRGIAEDVLEEAAPELGITEDRRDLIKQTLETTPFEVLFEFHPDVKRGTPEAC